MQHNSYEVSTALHWPAYVFLSLIILSNCHYYLLSSLPILPYDSYALPGMENLADISEPPPNEQIDQ